MDTDELSIRLSEADDFWLRLDNAAKIYPAVLSKELTSVFRIGVELKESVRIDALEKAIHLVEDRFPYFKVKLKSGFFWYYLEYSDQPFVLDKEGGLPCRSFDKNSLMFRILWNKHRIIVEFSHILTDGSGALTFLKTLLVNYYLQCEIDFSKQTLKHFSDVAITAEIYEDSYKRFFQKVKSHPVKVARAFQLPFRIKKKTPRYSVISAILPLKVCLEKAKDYNVSITAYLIAVYLFSLQEIFYTQTKKTQKRSAKKIRVEMPIDLRRIFPSRTMRNFSLYVIPEIDLNLGSYSFEEIVKTVYYQILLETDKKLIKKIISRNVSGEMLPIIRFTPLFVKSMILGKLYRSGTKNYSGVVTNFGKVTVPEEIRDKIKHFIFLPPPPNKIVKINCGVAGFKDNLMLSFGNISESNEFERLFLTYLVDRGIPVRLI